MNTTYFHIEEVTQWLKETIFTRGLYDDNNPCIILCDKDLEQTLDLKALHSAEVREKVATYLVRENHPSARIPHPTQVFDPDRRYLRTITNKAATQVTLADRATLVPHDKTIPPDQLFRIKYEFLEVLKTTAKMTNKDQTIFTYIEASNLFMRYIHQEKDNLIDNRHIKVVICEDDNLGIALGIRAFHHSQRWQILRLQLIPVIVKTMKRKRSADAATGATEEQPTTQENRTPTEEGRQPIHQGHHNIEDPPAQRTRYT